jgi:sugar/nucleoside kinase (ribokinase family)
LKKTLIVGTVAFDEIETPKENSGKILGGAATYIGLSSAIFESKASIVSVVGGDFDQKHLDLLNSKGLNTSSIEIISKGKTFYWKGKYHNDWNKRDTLNTQLNVLQTSTQY